MRADLPTEADLSPPVRASGDRARRARLAAGLWSVVVAALLLVPGKELPPVGLSSVDKSVHALLFAVHCLLLARALAAAGSAGGLALAALASTLYAVLLEAAQIPVPGRAWEWLDLVAGLAGIALAAAFVAWRRARLARPS